MTPQLVSPGYHLDRGYPNGYSPEDAKHFEKSRFAQIPAISWLCLDRVSVVGTTVLQGFGIAEEYCRSRAVPPLAAMEKMRARVKRLILPTRRVPTAIWALDHWSVGYFHWLVDVLPRLLAVREHAADAPFLLPEWYSSREYVMESLGLWEQQVSIYSARERVAVDTLYVTTYPRGCDFNAPSVRRVGEWFREREAAGSSRAARRVYISRRNARRRRILNEREVEEALRGRGFECLVFEDLSFKDQRELMYDTTHLVSNHGAGLANMIFMPPGSDILELKSDSHNVNNCFFHLADALRHRYWYSIAAGDSQDVQKANIFVDLERLHSRLDAFLF